MSEERFQDRLKRFADRLHQMDDWDDPAAQGPLRLLVALCWPYIDLYSRSKFVLCLDRDYLYKPFPDDDPGDADDVEIAVILREWHKILPTLSGKDRDFALSIAKRSKWKGFNPSPKQRAWIRQIWKERSIEAELEVTE